MKHKLINNGSERSFALVLDSGDEALGEQTRFARENRLDAARITGIGALSSAVLGYFNFERKEYEHIPIDEQVEVVSLVGDIARGPDGAANLHVHVVVAKRDGSAWGGHLIEARVRPTLEVTVVESPSYLQRCTDEASGLALISI